LCLPSVCREPPPSRPGLPAPLCGVCAPSMAFNQIAERGGTAQFDHCHGVERRVLSGCELVRQLHALDRSDRFGQLTNAARSARSADNERVRPGLRLLGQAHRRCRQHDNEAHEELSHRLSPWRLAGAIILSQQVDGATITKDEFLPNRIIPFRSFARSGASLKSAVKGARTRAAKGGLCV